MKRGRPALSPWIDGTVRPVRIGVYERRFYDAGTVGFSLWNGRRWHVVSATRDKAARSGQLSTVQFVSSAVWRGRAQP